MFSRRTAWESSTNRLTAILEARRSAGKRVLDLTVSNPTLCGFRYPDERILKALSGPDSLKYEPDPHGLLEAREAIAGYYGTRGIHVHPDDLFITASTSESYSLLFRLLCNPEDTVLTPSPSYPLFDYLAGINDVRTATYRIVRGERWSLDVPSLRKAMARTVKAVLAVDPHNPTGSFLTEGEARAMSEVASGHGAAVILDEVFSEYRLGLSPAGATTAPPRAAGTPEGLLTPPAAASGPQAGLTFVLNGLSKMAALPQVKLGWIALRGDHKLRAAARSRLGILNDIFLSAGTPAQAALPGLLAAGEEIRPEIRARLRANYAALCDALDGVHGCAVLPCEGGWNAVVRLPGGMEDEECAVGLLDDTGVYCYPGYFFDFEEDDVMVVSLLPRPEEFSEGVAAMASWVGSASDREG